MTRSARHLVRKLKGRSAAELRERGGQAWASACEAAGLTGRLFHDLRRTGVRNLIRAGVDRTVAMKISGHRTESVFERYNIDTDADLRAAMEKLSTTERQIDDLAIASL